MEKLRRREKETASTRQRRKVTRAFKIDDNLNRSLLSLADKSGITPSSILSSLLKRHVEWGQFTGTGTGFVTIDKEILSAFMEELSEDRLVEIARSSALVSIHNFLKFRYQKLNSDAVLDYLSTWSTYSNVGDLSIVNEDEPEKRFEINFRHSYGMKWSIFLSEYISGICSSFLEMETNTEISPLGFSIVALKKD